MKVTAIRDIKAGAYMNPEFMQTLGGYLRAVADEVNSEQRDNRGMLNPLARHPEDYEIWEIAEWDEINGKLKPLDTPISHGVLANFKIAKA